MVVSRDPGSFRDPSGRIFYREGRVFRTVMPCSVEDFEFVESSGFLRHMEEKGYVIKTQIVDPMVIGEAANGARFVLEHPRIPFVSYPYEWPFSALRAAALMHLDIHLAALENGITLSDASAYNMQFVGPRPVFIDRLSFRRYRDGEFWTGHRQFCEQFLNPLLLRAALGVAHNSWFRGSQEGITTRDMRRLLPWHKKFSWKVLTHVVLPDLLQGQATTESMAESASTYENRKFPLGRFRALLMQLRAWIARLKPLDAEKSTWVDYNKTRNYSPDEIKTKYRFVADFVQKSRPSVIADFGCNTGDYAAIALEAGVRYAVGFDFDQASLDVAFSRAEEERLSFLPLYLDAANPSPNQGWAENERYGLGARLSVHAVLCLAFVHHLAIGRNIPLNRLVDWLVGFAPAGIIEFVPKEDPMAQHLLRFRKDIFERYSEGDFLASVEARAKIMDTQVVSKSGRKLISYTRK